ncbi:MAG: Smr/MutS family protein [Treponema sp.]|nr:Smr/MutS family protein [Treponema sp.]
MDFGKILDQWNKQAGPVHNKDADLPPRAETSASRRRRLLRKSPDGIIDLHGLTRDQAWNALGVFFNDAKIQGLEKLLVIHGKGSHSPSETGVLTRTTRDFIERCPFAGESGLSGAAQGGSGSTWVLLKAAQKPPERRPGTDKQGRA